MYERILPELEKVIEQEVGNFSHDLGKMEDVVKSLTSLLGQGLLQRLVERGANGYEGSSINCTCGESMKFVQHRKRDIHTIFGWITVQRAYYYCASCGRGFSPYDQDSGLGSEQLSPALSQACCLLAVDDSFQQVSRKIEHLFGQRVCDDTVKEVVHKAGSQALAQADEQIERFLMDKDIPCAENKPDRLYVGVDGTTVHESDGWHEAKVGCIWWEDERLGEQKRYVGRFDNSENFGWHVWVEACKCGFREAEEVVYIGDGAGWIRNEQQRHFAKATFIIDWFHVSEHVWDCGKTLLGEGTEATRSWVEERLSLLWDGWTKKLLDDLEEQYKQHRGAKREALADLIRYIGSNEEQMRYDVFRKKGYKTGSGAVEGACKHVVGKRLKQAGMIWSREGSAATLALRIVWLNGRWEQLWKTKPLAA
jgi:hypothetical protein